MEDTKLHRAAERGDLETVRALLAGGADVNAKGWSDWTPLHYAAKRHFDVVELLLAHGADVNADGAGDTPLSLAVLNDKDDIAALLRQHGGRKGTRPGVWGERL